MTEREWLACADQQDMVSFLLYHPGRPRPSRRKLRLYGCGCCRLVWDALPRDACRRAVAAEDYAAGATGPAELAAAHHGIYGDPLPEELAADSPQWRALMASHCASNPDETPIPGGSTVGTHSASGHAPDWALGVAGTGCPRPRRCAPWWAS